jgi:hypothetical protein
MSDPNALSGIETRASFHLEKVPACSVCGRQDETLRVVIYPYVFSLIIVTFRRAFAGVWCQKHRRAPWFLASLITATLGWIGIPHGLLWTPITLFKLARGGDQPVKLNSEMLRVLAEHKLQQNDAPGAVRCLEASLQFNDDSVTRESLQAIRTRFGLPTYEGGGWRIVLTLVSVLLGAAGTGTIIGILDFVITILLSSLMASEVPIYVAIFSWTPFIAMAFIGGLILSQLIEWALTRIRCRNQFLAIGMSIIAAALAVYGVLQGSALSAYIVALVSGEFESTLQAIFTGILTLFLGGVLWGLELTKPAATSDVIYNILLLIIVVYYLAIATSTASRIVRWQQRLSSTELK